MPSPVPLLPLAISYWLHMLATVMWVGGLTFMALLLWPGARRVLGGGVEFANLIRDLQRRFNPMAWISLGVLVVTGLIQMSANENYTGFLDIRNAWTAAILAKHIAVAGMAGIGAYMNGSLQPRLVRMALLEKHGQPAAEADTLRRRELQLTRLNLLGGVLVLAFTAIARSV